MNSNVDFFADQSGKITDDEFFSRLLIRYPRKFGPFAEALFDLRMAAAGVPRCLARAAAADPHRLKVLIVGVEVATRPESMQRVRDTLPRSRHDVVFETKDVAGLGRFENLNILVSRHRLEEFDWLIITDDDIAVPTNFLDQFLFVLQHFGFKIGQPAHNLVSYATFKVTRRHWGTIARRTGFVEVGPLVALHRDTFEAMVPFPPGNMGWGRDVHWSYLAEKHGWAMGIVDALPIRHLRPIGIGYNSRTALSEAREFLNTHGSMARLDALRTVATYRTL